MGHKKPKSWYIVQFTGLICTHHLFPHFLHLLHSPVEVKQIFCWSISSCTTFIGPSLLNTMVFCRVPNPNAVVVVHTPSGVFSARSVENQTGCFRGSRLISLKKTEVPESSTIEINEFEPLSAARCRVFKRSNYKVTYVGILLLYNMFVSSE